ncbi:MAG: hypothetical protein K0S07_1026 [Chlamydiales bacterium]|jgi:hypothetical protein|nr:hypothetical protein [Chlamydiales bacterium]
MLNHLDKHKVFLKMSAHQESWGIPSKKSSQQAGTSAPANRFSFCGNQKLGFAYANHEDIANQKLKTASLKSLANAIKELRDWASLEVVKTDGIYSGGYFQGKEIKIENLNKNIDYVNAKIKKLPWYLKLFMPGWGKEIEKVAPIPLPRDEASFQAAPYASIKEESPSVASLPKALAPTASQPLSLEEELAQALQRRRSKQV